ncbi:MAG: endonuclease domain-containing protein [Candidatus Rokuibacteriota bacterium]
MSETLAACIPSPLWGEGRVRGEVETLVVCESPRDFARGLRRRQTDAEGRIWARLRNRRLLGVKFSRQVSIGQYIVDFCCREQKLIVELDGGQHAAHADYDVARTAFLGALDYRVLRFWDNDALVNTDGVLQRIAEALSATATLPSPRPSPQRGERESRGTLAPEGGEGRVRGSR